MSKWKARIITGIIGAMLLLIAYGLSRLYPRVYLACLGVMGVVGYAAVTALLYRWLRPAERERAYLAPPVTGCGHSQTLHGSSPRRGGSQESETVKVWEPSETEARPVETGITPENVETIIGEVGEWEKVTA